MLSGLNVVSEVYLWRESLANADIMVTSNRYGLYGGVLVPVPMIIVSRRLRKLLKDHKIRGFHLEIAHLVASDT